MDKYILYGVCRDSRHARAKELVLGGGTILYWCDSNPACWDETNKIFPPEKIKENPEAIVVINCFPVKQVIAHLQALGCKNKFLVYPLLGYYFYIEDDLGYDFDEARLWTKAHEEEIISLYETTDEVTDYILKRSLKQRLMEKPRLVAPEEVSAIEPLEYFYDDKLNPPGNITLIDGGAFIGDSIMAIHKKFQTRLKKIYAFEPDKQNVANMETNLSNVGLADITEIVPCGMSDSNGVLRFSSSDEAWSKYSEDGDIKVPVTKIDDVVQEIIGDVCVKMDVEGSEVAALHGATGLIKNHAPYMAICIYHRHKDILDVPQTIKAINPNYRFYLRSGFHTECYAVPQR